MPHLYSQDLPFPLATLLFGILLCLAHSPNYSWLCEPALASDLDPQSTLAIYDCLPHEIAFRQRVHLEERPCVEHMADQAGYCTVHVQHYQEYWRYAVYARWVRSISHQQVSLLRHAMKSLVAPSARHCLQPQLLLPPLDWPPTYQAYSSRQHVT